ncbi:hypothetical protein DL93DRAFT_2225037 [Clavulina sp. PMI_390]|nr:hypothetical protein DL93DRAFT_2225037 [Clavulina sp. PMI_390]
MSSTRENLNVEHAAQISQPEPANENMQSSNPTTDTDGSGGKKTTLQEDTKDVGTNDAGSLIGKLLPTASHLFKLVLPLPEDPLSSPNSSRSSTADYPPTVFLLHPSQPLSHISRLIASSFPDSSPRISFQSSSPSEKHRSTLAQGGDRDDPIVSRQQLSGRNNSSNVDSDETSTHSSGLQWSDSTDIGDFVKEAALDTEFLIVISPESGSQSRSKKGDQSASRRTPSSITIRVQVPSFADRTHFLRARLAATSRNIGEMEELKRQCDREAHRGARRVALSGFGALVAYWGAVARLTFWDVGWDVMEPVTYLSGLSTVICGYLWFLYQGREVSYSSVLSTSIVSRRQALYASHGFDMQRWSDLMDERKALRREIQKIAVDYDVGWKEGENPEDSIDDEDLPNSGGEEVQKEGKDAKAADTAGGGMARDRSTQKALMSE